MKERYTINIRKIALFILMAFPLSILAQQQSDLIRHKIQKYEVAFPMEKVYLHTDKPLYNTGDTLRFSAYLTSGFSHAAASLSGVLYVDLLEPKSKRVVVHKILRIKNGRTSGSIVLRDSLPTSALLLRAYTTWMRNFSEVSFFHKAIPVYQTAQPGEKPLERNLEELSKIADIQFFPEGGYLVTGIQNNIGVKGINRLGRGVNFSGYVISNKNDTITFVRSAHVGLGNFTFVPEHEKTYSLWIRDQNHNQEFKLPLPKREGYNFIVNNLGKNLVKVYATHNFNSPDRAILVAHQRGKIIYLAQTSSNKNSTVFTIPKDSIPSDGIVHLTLFNSAGIPQCERIIYIDKGEPLAVTIKPNKDIYEPREKVKLEISVKNHHGNPVSGSFSLAVTNAKVKNLFSENIETYLLLSSDVQDLNTSNEIKGTIEQPGYYFDKKNPNAFIHLDLLLLTQGWRRFLWKDILKDSLPTPTHGFENGITIRGQALLPSRKPLKSVMDVVIMVNGRFIIKTTDNNGRFEAHNLGFMDSTTVLVQGLKEKGTKKQLDVLFDKPDIPIPAISINDESYTPFRGDDLSLWLRNKFQHDSLLAIFKLNKVQTLKEIEIAASRIEEDDRRMLYSASNYKTLKVDNNTCGGAIHILQLIQGRFAGVQVTGSGFNMSVLIRGEEPTLVIDGIPMSDTSYLTNIVPCDVEAIDIINSPSVIFGAMGGVISILTKRGSNSYDWAQEKAYGITINKIRGFDTDKEFYSPKYENKDYPVIPDYRSTLYWNPFITTDSKGMAEVEFWNSDEKTIMKAILEGISTTGKPATANVEYTVK